MPCFISSTGWSLGINAVEPLPIVEFEITDEHGLQRSRPLFA